jgi:DNA-binding response OmpR family regulator
LLSFGDVDAQMASELIKKATDTRAEPDSEERRARYWPEDMAAAPRILIVDDDEADSEKIAAALTDPKSKIGRLGCEITKVKDVEGARAYLKRDCIDLYFLDLEISERWWEPLRKETGRAFVQSVVDSSNAGIIVCSNLPIDEEAPPLIDYGADDYVEKSYGFSVIAPRAISVWRRIQGARPRQSHVGRTFLIGNWKFTVGKREITDNKGISRRLSITEHVFLRHLCVVQDHLVNSEIFNLEVLRREKDDTQVRLDVFVPRLRAKFDNTIDLLPQGRSGFYKLLEVREVAAC